MTNGGHPPKKRASPATKNLKSHKQRKARPGEKSRPRLKSLMSEKG
jgi:hypothetical protein